MKHARKIEYFKKCSKSSAQFNFNGMTQINVLICCPHGFWYSFWYSGAQMRIVCSNPFFVIDFEFIPTKRKQKERRTKINHSFNTKIYHHQSSSTEFELGLMVRSEPLKQLQRSCKGCQGRYAMLIACISFNHKLLQTWNFFLNIISKVYLFYKMACSWRLR